MNQDLVGKKAVVIVRGNPDDYNPDPIQDFINQHQIDVQGEWFYDWRSGDTDWTFRRYEGRLGFSKGVERGVDFIVVEPNFFFSIGQVSSFEQKLIIRMMDNFNCPLVSIAGSFDSVSFHHTTPNYDDLLDAVVSYEKLRNQLSKLRRKTQNQEVSDILFKVGYKNSKGNPFHQAQITEFYRQSENLTLIIEPKDPITLSSTVPFKYVREFRSMKIQGDNYCFFYKK